MSDYPAIAIDGPAASGKSTLGRMVSQALGLRFLDTGLLYRAVGHSLLEEALDPDDATAAERAARKLDLEALDKAVLRQEAVGNAASKVAVMPRVRSVLLELQRAFTAVPPGAVLVGRDIGTVVLPDADLKLFVTADVELRARRRYDELRGRGFKPIYRDVLNELRQRDQRDLVRAVAPLRAADDAFHLDTSDLSTRSALEVALGEIERRLGLRARV